MTTRPFPVGPHDGPVAAWRERLARCDRESARLAPILEHRLSEADQSLFSEEIVARVKGMTADLARQLLRAQAEAAGRAGRAAFAERHAVELAEVLQGESALLQHCHALALEGQLLARFEEELGLDPVLSPIVQQFVAAEEPALATAAMQALAAQARFTQTQRRMELPLRELPADLFHAALLAWRAWNGTAPSEVLVRAEARLRNGYDEGAQRLALLARLVAACPTEDRGLLAIELAGVALFLSALAARSGQGREAAILATNLRQSPRLALMMRAAGCTAREIASVLVALHGDRARLPEGDAILPADARALLDISNTKGHE